MYFQDLQAEFPEFYNQENDPTASSSRVGAHVQSNNQYQNAADFQRNYRYMRGILPPRAQSIPVRLETPVREPLFFMPSSMQEPTVTPGVPLLRPIDSMVYSMMPTNYVPVSLQQMLFRQAGMPGFVFDAAPGHTVYVPYVQYNHQPMVPAVVSSSSSGVNRTNMFNTQIVNTNIPHGTQFITHQSTMNQARRAWNDIPLQHIPLNFMNTVTTSGVVSEQSSVASSSNTPRVPDQSRVETDTDSQTLNYQNMWQSSYELVKNAADQLMQERNIRHPLRRQHISGQAPFVNSAGNTVEEYYTSSISDIEVGISGVRDNVLRQEMNENDQNRDESEMSSQNVDLGEPLYILPHSSNLTTALVDMMKDLLPASLPELAFISDEHVRLQLLESYNRRNLPGDQNHEDESTAQPAFACVTNITQGNSVTASTTSESKVSVVKNLVNVTSSIASSNSVPSVCSSKNTLSESSSSSADSVSSNNIASVGTVLKGYTVRRKEESVSRRRRGEVTGATEGSPSKSMKTANRLVNSKHKGIDDTGDSIIVNKTVISDNIKNISNSNSVTADNLSHCVTVTCSAGTSSSKLAAYTTQRNFVSGTSNAIYSTSDTGSIAGTSQTSPVAGTSQTSPVAGTSQTSPVAGTSQTSPVAGTSQTSPVAGTSQTSPVDGTSQTSPVAGTSQTSPAAGTSQTSSVADSSKECAYKSNKCDSKIASRQHLNNGKCIHPAKAFNNVDRIPVSSVINEKNSTQNTVKRIPTTLDQIQADQGTSLVHHPSQYDSLAHRAWRNRILFESQRFTEDEYLNRNNSVSTSRRMITSMMQYLYRLITPMPDNTHPVDLCLDPGNVHTNAENVDVYRNQRNEIYRLAGLNDLVQVPSDCSFSSTEAHTSLSFSSEPESPDTEQQGPLQRYFHNLVYQFYVETFMWIYASIVTQPRYVNIWTLVQLIGQGLQQSPADVLVPLLAGFLDGAISSVVSQMDMVDLILQQVESEREVFPELIATLCDLSVLFYLRLDPSTYFERFSEVVSQAARNLIFQQEQPQARTSRATEWNNECEEVKQWLMIWSILTGFTSSLLVAVVFATATIAMQI